MPPGGRQDAISVIETDCEVDFAPPLDYVEPSRDEFRNYAAAAPPDSGVRSPPGEEVLLMRPSVQSHLGDQRVRVLGRDTLNVIENALNSFYSVCRDQWYCVNIKSLRLQDQLTYCFEP